VRAGSEVAYLPSQCLDAAHQERNVLVRSHVGGHGDCFGDDCVCREV
jgi:hypothetical protein